MNIEIKNVKYAAFASEETHCFSASVYIEGEKAGEVSNDGHGGSNHFRPYELQTFLNTYAKTLPAIDCSNIGAVEPHRFIEQDAETLIGEMVNDWLAARDLKRLLSKRVLFQEDGKIMQTRVLTKDRMAKCIGQFNKPLNDMPFAEALKVYRERA